MANAFKVRPSGVTLVRKPSGYYLRVVVYVPRAFAERNTLKDGGANPGLEHPQPEEQLKPIASISGSSTNSPSPTACSSSTRFPSLNESKDSSASFPGRRRAQRTTNTPAIV